MPNQSINLLTYFIAFSIMLFLFGSCQETIIEPNTANEQPENLQKDSSPLIPDTYVRGIVYKQGYPRPGATVKLYIGTTYLTQTTSDGDGEYIICVCCQGAGAGTYYVKGSYIDKWGQAWTDTKSFYYDPWSWPPPPEYIDKDLYLGIN